MPNTPNINLEKPVVGEDTWSEAIEKRNRNDDKLDGHDHSNGKGVPVPTAGLNINENLSVNKKSITNIQALNLESLLLIFY